MKRNPKQAQKGAALYISEGNRLPNRLERHTGQPSAKERHLRGTA